MSLLLAPIELPERPGQAAPSAGKSTLSVELQLVRAPAIAPVRPLVGSRPRRAMRRRVAYCDHNLLLGHAGNYPPFPDRVLDLRRQCADYICRVLFGQQLVHVLGQRLASIFEADRKFAEILRPEGKGFSADVYDFDPSSKGQGAVRRRQQG